MNKIKHVTEFWENFDFSQLSSNDLKLENTWRIIWEIRKKLFSLKNIDINDDRILDVLKILELTIHWISKMKFSSINELAYYIYWLWFDDIEENFLYHPFNGELFLDGIKEFIYSFNDDEINKAAESTMININFILEKLEKE